MCRVHRRAPLAGILLCRSVCQALQGAPWMGSYSVVPLHQSLKGAPWVGSYSAVQCVTHLIGQPLYCSSANAGMLGREAMVMAPPPTHDSAISPCFHDCSAFLHRHFPPQSPTHPLNPSLHSQQQPSPRDCSTIPKFQVPAAAPSRGMCPCLGYV